MDDTAFNIIVVILSVVLAVFLLLAIYVAVRLIQVTNHIKKITESAEQVADRAEHMSRFFEKTATPVAIVKLISNLSNVVQNKRRKNKEK